MIHLDLARDSADTACTSRVVIVSIHVPCSMYLQTGGDDPYGKAVDTGSTGKSDRVALREDGDHASQ